MNDRRDRPADRERPSHGGLRSQSGTFRDLLARLRSVSDAGHLLLDTEDLDRVHRTVLDLACEKMGASIGLMFIYDSGDNLLVLTAEKGLEDAPSGAPARVCMGQGLSGWVAENRQAVVVSDIREDGRFGSASFLHYKRLSAISVPITHRDSLLGVLTLCNENPGAFGMADLLTCEALAVSLAFGLRCNTLREEVRTHFLSIIQGLINALEAKDPVTQGHSMRIAHMCREISRNLGLARAVRDRIEIAARLHDIGKIGVPEQVLNKPSPLSEDEWALIRQHPSIGAEILKGIPALQEIAAIVGAHHEKLDGTGYPEGLSHDEIPLESRVISVADAFDAMVVSRPYRGTLNPEGALCEITACAGSQFDPFVVAALANVVRAKDFSHFYGDAGKAN